MGHVEGTSADILDLVKRVESGELALPEIQRGEVWSRPDTRDLFDSLYRGYPVGTIVLWRTADLPYTRSFNTESSVTALSRPPDFVLDGQQRLTALAHVLRHEEPDIRFNVEREEFAVGNAAIKNDPKWVKSNHVFQDSWYNVYRNLGLDQDTQSQEFSTRLERLSDIQKTRIPVQILREFEYNDVTEIFVRINSKGRRLKQAELSMAQLAFKLPGIVSDDLRVFSDELGEAGYDLDMSLILRCLTGIVKHSARFRDLDDAQANEIREGWEKTKPAVRDFLNLLKMGLRLDNWNWVRSANAMVGPVVYLACRDRNDINPERILRWFLLTSVWSHYSSQPETRMTQDIRTLTQENDPFSTLEQRIMQHSGRLKVSPDDLEKATSSSQFSLAAFLACYRFPPLDWKTGLPVSDTHLGSVSSPELHHIFPRAIAIPDYGRELVDEVANLAFISRLTNQKIGKTPPSQYLIDVDPERLSEQFIPSDDSLWDLAKFEDFLKARRQSLADGINALLESPMRSG